MLVKQRAIQNAQISHIVARRADEYSRDFHSASSANAQWLFDGGRPRHRKRDLDAQRDRVINTIRPWRNSLAIALC